MSKLTTIRIKYENGTYSDQIPVGVFAENVNWNDEVTLVDVLGQVAFKTKGTIQEQIDRLLIEKIDYDKLNAYMIEQLPAYINNWVNDNISFIRVDKTLSETDFAADAKVVGDQIRQIKSNMNNISIDRNELRSKLATLEDVPSGSAFENYLKILTNTTVASAINNLNEKIDNFATYSLYIDCPNGTNIHRNKNVILNAHLFRNSIEVTNEFGNQCFTWTRHSSDYYGDIYWNDNQNKTKSIIVTPNDVRINADFRCVFQYEDTIVTSE